MARALALSVLLLVLAGAVGGLEALALEGRSYGCAFCGHPPNPPWHYPGCRYYRSGGGGGGDEPRQINPEAADFFLSTIMAPISVAFGFCDGFVWLVDKLVGLHPNQSAARSWSNQVTARFPKKDKGVSGGFWARAGGLPWLALYGTGWGLGWCAVQTGHGVAWCGRKVAAPFKPGPELPPEPSREQYQRIGEVYGQLREAAETRRAQLAERVNAAEARRDRYLDEFIDGRAEMKEILEKEGRAAARAAARKTLDAWAEAFRQRQKTAAQLAETAAELKQVKDEAFEKAAGHVKQLATLDYPLDATEDQINELVKSGKLTRPEVADLLRQKRALNVTRKTQAGIEAFKGLGELHAALKADLAGGRTAADWAGKRQTREDLLRVGLGLLSATEAGTFGGDAEKAMDYAYALTAELRLAGTIAKIDREIERANGARWYQDERARDWLARTGECEAWKGQEAAAAKLRNQYQAEMQTNARKAGGK